MTKDEFWDYIVNDTSQKFYEKFDYPINYHNDLVNVSEYCSRQNIKLIFWIPPTHDDFQNKKKEFDMIKADKKFVSDLSEIGVLYNFEYPSEITSNKANYKDPYAF